MTRVLPLLLFLVSSTPLAAQDRTPLRPGQVVAATLAPDGRHTYTLELVDGTFVYGQVDQNSVDVRVTLLAPDGDEIAGFDGPARGAERFTFSSDTAGAHTVVVEPADDGEEGEYEVRLLRVEPVATNPGGRVDQLMAPYSGDDTPGAVVGILDRGEVVFERAYGMANLTYAVPHEVETPTNIGSVSKQFTGMAILLLQNDGLLSLDDEVRKHIPELPDFGVPITIRNLLNHTGGFREIYNFLPMTGRQGEDHIDREEAVRIVQRQPELQAEPDTEYNYNNTGFILLSMIVERASGMSFPEFMRQRVFEPLGMHDTRVKFAQGEIIPGASTPYVPAEDGGWRTARDLAASAGAGGIYTTFRDMTKWMLNYRDGTVGGAGALEHLTTRNVLADGDTTGYGLGLGISVDHRGTTRYAHTGGDVAHRTYFAYFPELESGIFLSSNNATFGFAPIREIEDLFFGDRLDAEGDEETAAAAADMPVARMEAIAGNWLIEAIGLPVEIRVEDGTLRAEPAGQSAVELTPTSDSTVAHEGLNVTIVFHFEEDGTVSRATFTQGQASPMTRFEPVELGPEELDALTGRYFSRELELWVEIRRGDEGLELHRLRGEPVELEHREGLTFGGSFPFGEVEFVRASNGTITGLLAANGRTRGVLFVRQ